MLKNPLFSTDREKYELTSLTLIELLSKGNGVEGLGSFVFSAAYANQERGRRRRRGRREREKKQKKMDTFKAMSMAATRTSRRFRTSNVQVKKTSINSGSLKIIDLFDRCHLFPSRSHSNI